MIHRADLLCFTHLRWDFASTRPNHLMARFARDRRVFFFEEPLLGGDVAELSVTETGQGVTRVVPRLPVELPAGEVSRELKRLLDGLLGALGVERYDAWYDTPSALPFTRHLTPGLTVYDVMEDLQSSPGVAPELIALEAELFSRADVVFTVGDSLYRAKQHLHREVYAFPSSVDVAHFARARLHAADPADQAALPRPRVGFFGVVDERLDLRLISELATARPRWQLVLVGPVVKRVQAQLPRLANLHWLWAKKYSELPEYLAGWDVAFMPYAINDATRFISPSKTLELLAAGRPVVTTPVTDVVKPYGELELVRVAGGATELAAAIEAALDENRAQRQARADAFLAATSWDLTWQRMNTALETVRERGVRRAA
jgi:glycosyltransferase involved in cell wall biosynthesis